MPLAGLHGKNKNICASKVELPPETDPADAATDPAGPVARRSRIAQPSGDYDTLSMMTMLVRTNDAFTGLDSFKVKAGTSTHVNAYDNGSEKNNEDPAAHPGPAVLQPDDP